MKATVIKELKRIPGVGDSIAEDLFDLGIHSVKSLMRKDPQQLYDNLCAMRQMHIDRCMLYVFRCAVYFATKKNPDPEKLKWWKWKDKK